METTPESEESTENSHKEAEASPAADDGYSEEAFAASAAYHEDFEKAAESAEAEMRPARDTGNGKEPAPLMNLDEAIARIPEELREQMESRLRAEFREVRRYRKK